MNDMVKTDAKLGLVLYTDGSANPNPGYVGWGAHGYIYQIIDSPKKHDLHENILTDKGYVSIIDFKEDSSEYKIVEPTHFLTLYGSSNALSTNNVAEMLAMKNSLDYIIKNNFKFETIQIYTDSNYVQKGICEWSEGWLKTNWVKRDGSEVSNRLLWEQVLLSVESIKHITPDTNISWVKGHKDHLGNLIADCLASNGSNDSANDIHNEEYTMVDAKDYFVNKVDVNPILSIPRMIFSSDPAKNNSGLYYMVKPSKPDIDIGVNDVNTTYCIVYLKEPDSVLEAIRARQSSVSKQRTSAFLAKTDSILNQKYYQWIKNNIYQSLKRKSQDDNSLLFFNNTPITIELNPAGLSFRAIEYFGYLEHVFNTYLNEETKNSFEYTETDITEKFFSLEEKKVKKEIKYIKQLRPEIKPGFKNTSIEVIIGNDKFKIPMALGLDLPDRNVLKKLEGENPRIILITRKESANMYRYLIIISTDKSDSIWSNLSTTSIFIK